MNHARALQPPGASRKRKERDSFHSPPSLQPLVKPTAVNTARHAKPSQKGAEPSTKPIPHQQQPMSSNRLLAGYMAHEFLTKGTLFGEKFDPVVAAESRNKQADPKQKQASSSEAEAHGKVKPHGYMEVANLVKSDGAHIPGVVNPTQLARWIIGDQMQKNC